MPYERALIPHLAEIRLEFHEALEEHDAGYYNPEYGQIPTQSETTKKGQA